MYIPTRALQNRAVHGDLVAVRPLPRARWCTPHASVKHSLTHALTAKSAEEAEEEEEEAEAELLSDDVDEGGGGPVAAVAAAVPTGEVVAIVQRMQLQRDIVACLQLDEQPAGGDATSSARQRAELCVPMDRRIPKVRVVTRQVERLRGQRFVVRMDGWERTSMYPHGHLVRVVGPIGDAAAESAAVLVHRGILEAPFSAAWVCLPFLPCLSLSLSPLAADPTAVAALAASADVMAVGSRRSLEELPRVTGQEPWQIPPEEVAVRRDTRTDHRTYSIDPVGSKDVDDALSVRRLPDGLLEVGVHIADVSHFVRAGSLLDEEARARGTTVYLIDRRIDMLPALLSENLCSLLGRCDRLAKSVIWTVDPSVEYRVLDTWMGDTIIHNRHQMSYEQAQAILDGHLHRHFKEEWQNDHNELAEVRNDLGILAAMAERLRQGRLEEGALELASAELRFDVDTLSRKPVGVRTKQELPMMSYVAELMICANATALAQSLQAWHRGADPTVEMAIKTMATRAMSQAEYVSTGAAADAGEFRHYGLALQFYTHFTSPIRRYADIIVHRMLAAALRKSRGGGGGGPAGMGTMAPYSHAQLQQVNERHTASKLAQRDCSQLYLLLYLASHSRAERALITGIHAAGVSVFIPKYDLRGPLHLKDKQGHIILPAHSDDDAATSSAAGGRRLSLQRQKKSIHVVDEDGGEVLCYGLLQPIWIELRADGSRAHAPTLRIRALSESHPAVQEAAATAAAAKMHSLSMAPGRPPPPPGAAATGGSQWRGQGLAQLAQGGHKKDTPASLQQLVNAAPSAQDVLAVFQKPRVEGTALIDLWHKAVAEQLSGGGDVSLPPSVSLGEPALLPDEHESQTALRARWQHLLAKVAKVRARRLWSMHPEDEQRQQKREAMERTIRSRSQFVLSQWVGPRESRMLAAQM
eukprot:jgi/Mesen1/4459/ME000227S03481